ncbi:MAG TPA: hypothetical protein VGS13_06980 [Stellaceae bacterium]|nr:hypothetical protein [Stellaceae bacterium]
MTAPIALAAAFLVAALAGCTGFSSAPLPPNVLAAATVTESVEQDGKFIALVGPRRPHAEPFLGVADTNFDLLRSWIDTRSGETAHQLYVEDSYFGAERNWEAARIQGGPSLRFIPISKNKISCDNGCSYAEEFAATLPETLLRASPRGLAVSFTAQSGGEQTILVPGDVIARQLAAVDAARASLRTASAAPPRANPVR